MSKPDKVISLNTKENPSEAIDRVMRGVETVASVKATLGPYGRNFLIEKSGSRITNDGVTIAQQMQSKDEIEELAIRTVREAASKTNEEAGDGTTTCLTLAESIFKAAYEYLPREGVIGRKSVMSLRKSILDEAKYVVDELAKMAKPVETLEELIDVARVSVEDDELAKMVAEIQWEIGKDGVVLAEETAEPMCSVEKVEGIRIDNGLGATNVMNDTERQRLIVRNVPVLLTTYEINNFNELMGPINQMVQGGITEMVIMARAFSNDAIRVLMENYNKGIRVYPMNAPYINQREIMKDLEAVLGGRYINHEETTLDSVTASDFGLASQVVGYRYNATFAGDPKDENAKNRVKARIEKLEEEHKGEPSKFNKRAIEDRIAQLKTGFAIMKIGSISDADRKYKFDKVEDAVNAVRSALQSGTVKGGGLAMKEIAEGMPEDFILKEAFKAPYNQIMANAGETFKIEDWVRNSFKVERVATENAARIASTLITIGGAVATERIKPINELLSRELRTQGEA